jgi:hypothetical protein
MGEWLSYQKPAGCSVVEGAAQRLFACGDLGASRRVEWFQFGVQFSFLRLICLSFRL